MLSITDHFNHYRGKQHTASEVKNMITSHKQMGRAIEETCVYSRLPAIRALAVGKRLPCGGPEVRLMALCFGLPCPLICLYRVKPVLGTF